MLVRGGCSLAMNRNLIESVVIVFLASMINSIPFRWSSGVTYRRRMDEDNLHATLGKRSCHQELICPE
ncbi:hypothetical protein EGR_01167 [Echinococcus granulosus]|uniref:Uncharacterized protein n=1 Tax=Echinococcus granulosus TaxID=6210 RepID=W6VB82_ECHGR|nr:hypothetical protein EGR_01167 [Echinococcus granulosus]EUB64039.1 hypothetical protein EGR_01167 [Echinococcus granulosus]